MVTRRDVAIEIITKLSNATAEGNCTWGDSYPEAQKELFNNYFDDMVETIVKVLRNNRSIGFSKK